MDELHLLLKGILEVLQALVLVESLIQSTLDLVEEVRRRAGEHKHRTDSAETKTARLHPGRLVS